MRVTTPVLLLLIASASGWASNYGKLPLSFEANQGQTDARVQFLSHGREQTLFLTSTEAVLHIQRDVVRMKLAGSDPASKAEGAEPQIAQSNYFIGNDPAKWRTGVAQYGRVRFGAVYPGIDLVYYGKQGQLEYDWIVKPGADPSKIRLKFEGVQKMRVDANGDLVLETASGEIREKKPVLYQGKKEIAGRFVIRAGNQASFEVGAYDPTAELVIDPVLVYSSYFGSTATAQANSVAVDGNGNAYVTGFTAGSDFPTVGAEQGTLNGADNVFVSKISADGSTLIYSTYLGGSNEDFGTGIAVDSTGSAIVAGWTESNDFPVANAYQGSYSSKNLSYNAFVTKLNPAGNKLTFSTYLGGDSTDQANGIAVDASGNVYVTGATDSSDFPTTSNPINGGANVHAIGLAFLTKFSGAGALIYSTFLNSVSSNGNTSVAQGVAVDSGGNAYVTGYTDQTNFPLVSAVQSSCSGHQCIFAAKVNPAGSAFIFSTYLGGGQTDQGAAIAADSKGNAYVTGFTSSTSFPLVNAVQSTFGGGSSEHHPFVTEINSTGSSIVYSTYLGGSGPDEGFGIGVDSAGNTWIAGTTASTDFPMVNSLNVKFAGDNAWVSEISPGGSKLLFSSYVGASFSSFQEGTDRAGMTLDSKGNVYVAVTNGLGRAPANSTSLGGTSSQLLIFKIAPGSGTSGPEILPNGVVNGASFQPGLVVGSWATVQGTNLAPSSGTWNIVNGVLPTSVNDVSVTVGGQPAYVYFVSTGQINFIVPDVPTGEQPVIVTNAAGSSSAVNATVSEFGPAFFEWPASQVVATYQNFSYAAASGTFPGTTTTPAKPGDTIILWGTGFGPTTPVAPAGEETPTNATYSTETLPTVTINNVSATVYGAALAPGFAGLYQVAIQVPSSLGAGNWPVVATIGGVSSPSNLVLAVQ